MKDTNNVVPDIIFTVYSMIKREPAILYFLQSMENNPAVNVFSPGFPGANHSSNFTANH